MPNPKAKQLQSVLMAEREGLTLSKTAAYGLQVAAGSAVVSDAAGKKDVARLASAMAKILNVAWSAGAGGGALDTGVIANNTTYHIHLIYNPSTEVEDWLASLSPTSPTLPSGFTHFRRVGSILIRSNAILDFDQYGPLFKWRTPQRDLDNVAVPDSATLYALTVPTGFPVEAIATVTPGYGSPGALNIIVSDPAQNDVAPNTSSILLGAFNSTVGALDGGASGAIGTVSEIRRITNASAELRIRRTGIYVNNCGTTVQTQGWVDHGLGIGGGSGGGSGNVSGPASSTDRAIATFSGTDGKNLQDNPRVTIGSTGNLTLNAVGSSTVSPRVLGFSQASGEACRFQIGNESVSISNVFGGVTQHRSYFGVQYFGQQQMEAGYTEPGSNGFGPYSAFAVGSFGDPCHDFIRVQSTTAKAGSIVRLRRAETTNANPYLEWANNAGTAQGAITASGGLSVGSITDTPSGSIRASGPVLFGEYTVGTLPTASAWSGFWAFASDANAGFGAWVRSNGTNWIDLGYSRIVTTAAPPSGGTMQAIVLPANSGFAPSSNAARPDARAQQPVLAFDPATAWFWEWIIRLPESYAGTGLNVDILWTSATTGSGNVIWSGAFSRIQNGTTNLANTASYATAQAATSAAPGTTGVATLATITFSNSQISSAVAGEFVKLRLSRDAANASDTLAVESQVFQVAVRGA